MKRSFNLWDLNPDRKLTRRKIRLAMPTSDTVVIDNLIQAQIILSS